MSNQKTNRSNKRTGKQEKIPQKVSFFGGKRIRALIATILTAFGVYGSFVFLYFETDRPILDDIIGYQSTMVGLYINLAAIIATVHEKFSSSRLIHGRTFLLSILAILVAITIFCQATCMKNLEEALRFDFFREGWVAFLLQIGLFFSIYILILEPVIEMQKERIRK